MQDERKAVTITIAQLKQSLREVLSETNQMQAPRPLLTPDQVAETLQMNVDTVYDIIKRGELKAAKIGKFLRVEGRDLNEFIQKRDLTA